MDLYPTNNVFFTENTINGFVLGPIMYFSSAENAINGFVPDQQQISLLKMNKCICAWTNNVFSPA